MAVSKRQRWSPEWYVVSKRTIYLLVASLLGITGLIGGGYWLYQYLNHTMVGEEKVGRQSARFIQIEGKVKVKRANSTEFSTAREDMELEAGDTIQTQAEAVARVQFVDGSSYTIKPDTTLVIKDNSLASNKATSVHVKVGVGTINLTTGEQTAGSSNVIQTEAASASVGSHTEASVAAGEQTDIKVMRGSANVRTRTGEVFDARANERLQIENNGRLARREMLLLVPALRAPENQRFIRVGRGAAGAIDLTWGAVAQAQHYSVEIATSAYFGETVVARRDHLASPTAAFANLRPGAYYWRVRALDERGQASDYSEPFKFTLVGGVPSRALAISVTKQERLSGDSFVIEGQSEPGARVKVGGVAARVEANGYFRAFVILKGSSREVLIEAEDQDGNTGQKRLRL